MTSCTFERFTKDVELHQLTVLKDDGLYRHLKVAKPNSNAMHYNITTWPGYLCISGDMGCFTFYRLTDMFEFFRSTPGSINPTYWEEKVQAGAGHSGANAITSEPDFDAYETRLKEYLAEFVESLDPEDESEAQRIEEATDAVNDFINSYYAADGYFQWGDEDGDETDRSHWKPSIHMPRAASRIILEITGLRVERLNNISNEDCKAEGYPESRETDGGTMDLFLWFRDIWNSTGGNWAANPWVLVLEFKVLTVNGVVPEVAA